MVTHHLDQCSPLDRYRLLIGCIVPRPIAWVSTCNIEGVGNLAPFSFFNGVSSNPPTVMLAFGPGRAGPKDTLANLRDQGEAVIHLVADAQLAACHQSGAEYASGINEAEQLQLTMEAATLVRPQRLADAPVALECRYQQSLALGDDPERSSTAVFLTILCIHCADACCDDEGMPDPERLQPVARLGERAYLRGGQWPISHLDKQQVPVHLARPR